MGDSRRARILVVEDEPTLAHIYTRVLVAAGYDVDHAPDGAEGLERLSAAAYDLVLSDVRMPRVSGLQLLDSVRRWYPELPVVLMTAQLDMPAYEHAREQGAVRYLLKPVGMEQLARAVDHGVKLGALWRRQHERKLRGGSR